MKTKNLRWFVSIGQMLVVTVASPPLAGQAPPEVVAWGNSEYGQTNVPSGLSNVVAVAAGSSHSLALTAEGRVVAWGAGTNNTGTYSNYGQSMVPSGLSNVVAIEAGYSHSLALTAEGRVVAWGAGWDGQTNVPGGLSNVVAIAGGGDQSLALTAEGRVVAWPDWAAAQVPNGLSNVVAIAAGSYHSLALTAEGRVVAWGYNGSGETNVPSLLANVVAIAAGGSHNLALTADGGVVAWGAGGNGQTNVPSGLSDVVAIAAGGSHSLALRGLPPGVAAPVAVGPRFLVATADFPFQHRVAVKNGATSYGAVGLPVGLGLDPATGWITGQPILPGAYELLLSAANSVGASTWPVTLFVNEPAAPGFPGGLAEAGLNLPFRYAVVAYNAPEGYGASGLPAGLVLDAQTGVISGVPAEEGEFVVSLVATNRYGMGEGSLTLRVSPLAAWGWGGQNDSAGEVRPVSIPGGFSNVVAITAGGLDIDSAPSSLALTADGQVLRWDALYDWTEVYHNLGNVVAIAEGGSKWGTHSLALLADGRVLAFGHSHDAPVGAPGDVPTGLGNVVAIAEGVSHRLALTLDGRVVAWGSETNVPNGLSNVVAIAAGVEHSLALTAEGQVLDWGGSYWNGDKDVPLAAPVGLSNVVAIAAGDSHSLALTAEGRVVAWGWNELGQTNVPSGLSNVVAIAAGGWHSLALTAEGRVVAWGFHEYGQTNVPNGLSNVVAIATDHAWESWHNLGLTGSQPGIAPPAIIGPRLLVATANLRFYHRIVAKNGVEVYGATGLPAGLVLDPLTGIITGRPQATGRFDVVLSATNSVGSGSWAVTLFVNGPGVPVFASRGMVEVWVGYEFTYPLVASEAPEWYAASGLPPGLALDAASGVISGIPTQSGDFVVNLSAANPHGVGSGLLTLRVSPVVAWGTYNYWDAPWTAIPVTLPSGLSNVVAVAGGGNHSLALTVEGRVVAWGSDQFGQTEVPSGLSHVVAIAAASFHNLALTAEGRVVAWPANPGWAVPSGLSNVVAIAAAGSHNLALTAEGGVVAWGYDYSGETNVPAGLSNVVAVAGGANHSLALTVEGRVVAWGSDRSGQTEVPSGLSDVIAIAAGDAHSLALTAEGRVVAWGKYFDGNNSVPMTVPVGLSNVVAIAAGSEHSLALTAEGRVVAWGYNASGQTDVPSGLSNVVAIAAGGSHCLALLAQPTVPTPRLTLSRGLAGLEFQAHGAPGISCTLLRADQLPGPWLPAAPVSFTNAVQVLPTPDLSETAQFYRLLRK